MSGGKSFVCRIEIIKLMCGFTCGSCTIVPLVKKQLNVLTDGSLSITAEFYFQHDSDLKKHHQCSKNILGWKNMYWNTISNWSLQIPRLNITEANSGINVNVIYKVQVSVVQ